MNTFVTVMIGLLAWDVCAKVYRLWAGLNSYTPGAIALDAVFSLALLIWGCVVYGRSA